MEPSTLDPRPSTKRWTPNRQQDSFLKPWVETSTDVGTHKSFLKRWVKTSTRCKFSIGIYSCPMDPMDSIGTTFYPLIQHEWNFSKFLTNRKWTFPSESTRVQWIRWTPSERLSTPLSNMSGIFLSLSRIENELFHRNLFVSNGSDGLHRNDFLPPHPTWAEFF